MSYESSNSLPKGTRVNDVLEFLELMNYRRVSDSKRMLQSQIAEYYFFDQTDYRSWSGIGLYIFREKDGGLLVETRTTISRSYYDLVHQNNTIRGLKRRFGGWFRTDEGKGRYLHPDTKPPLPQESGCHLAFERFGSNLIKADIYLMNRTFPNKQWEQTGVLEFLDELNPRFLSNNLLLPYLVSVLEDYFKSTFIALLRYSPKKEMFLKGVRVSPENLAKISSQELSVEQAVAENLPFQRISAIGQHFKALDSKLDLAGALLKPYRRRKVSLFKSLDALTVRRHDFIHKGVMDITFNDADVKKALNDLEASVVRCYRRITDHYGWPFEKDWSRGRNA
jgi:hypothetical protein